MRKNIVFHLIESFLRGTPCDQVKKYQDFWKFTAKENCWYSCYRSIERLIMDETLLDEYCATICRSGLNTTDEQLKASLDLFVDELRKVPLSHLNSDVINQTVSSLNTPPFLARKLTEVELVKHTYFLILRDAVIIDRFRRRNVEGNLTDQVLLNVSILFMNLFHNVNDTNAVELKKLLFYQPLIDELAQCSNEMSTYGQHLNDLLLCRSLSCLLRPFKHYQVKIVITDEYALSTPIFCAVSQCLSSSHAVSMIHRLGKNFTQKLDPQQTLFLDTMSSYLQ